MKEGQGSYVPPAYLPLSGLEQSDSEAGNDEDEVGVGTSQTMETKRENFGVPHQWSSGICACCDDLQSLLGRTLVSWLFKDFPHLLPRLLAYILLLSSTGEWGFIGLICPCFLFGKNAEFLGSGTFVGSCMTHFILWVLVNTICCFLTEGLLLGLPGCFVSCYACGYRRTLRSRYNLPEAPCGDFVTHFFCHLCATCQEFREIRERSGGSNSSGLDLVEVTAPQHQKMESSN